MASVWIRTRETSNGEKRWLVEYRHGGYGSKNRHGGSFKTKRLATIRAGWIEGELAALRAPNLTLLEVEQPKAPTLADAMTQWRESRVDVDEQTANMHRSAVARIAGVAPAL